MEARDIEDGNGDTWVARTWRGHLHGRNGRIKTAHGDLTPRELARRAGAPDRQVLNDQVRIIITVVYRKDS